MKTVQYNDLTQYTYEEIKNFDYMFSVFKEFVKNGGDLNLDVGVEYMGESKIEPISSWLNRVYPDNPEYFLRLINEKLINNIFTFNIDHENKIINDIPSYGFYFMKNNFNNYKKDIIQAIVNLAKDIKDWDLGDFSRKAGRGLARLNSEEVEGNPSYNHTTYNGFVKTKLKHPLLYLILHFQDSDLLEQVLNTDEKYLKLFKDEDLREVISYGNLYKNAKFVYILYKYDILDDILYKKTDDGLSKDSFEIIHHYIISEAIKNNDIETITKTLSYINLKEIDLLQSPHFFSQARTDEMIQFLINNDVYTYLEFNDGVRNYYINSLRENNDIESFSKMIEHIPAYQKLIIEQPKKFFNLIDDHNTNLVFEKIKLITENFNFPIDKIEAIDLAFGSKNFEENLSWLIENGYDPRKCEKFMSNIFNRKDGLKTLRAIKKQELFESFAPDPIYWILNNVSTKDYYTWLDRVPAEQFMRYTIKGEPAWWGFSYTYGYQQIIQKNINLDQLSANKYSYLYYLVKNKPISHHSKTEFYENLNKIEKKLGHTLPITGHDENGNNIFHHLFSDPSKGRENSQYIAFEHILKSNENFVYMLMEENANGVKAIDSLIDFVMLARQAGINTKGIELTQKILMKNIESFDFDFKIVTNKKELTQNTNGEKEEVPLISILKTIITKDSDLEYLTKIEESKELYKSLTHDLNNKEQKSNVLKI